MQRPRRGQPERLWFRFPQGVREDLSLDADPFVVALLLVAMQSGEEIDVEGPVSEPLLRALSPYQAVFARWFPERFRPIVVRARVTHSPSVPEDKALRTACAFSGGVDSFYTFLERARSSEPVTDALFMAGFDMPLHLEASIGELTRSYAALMQERGVRFTVGSTNVRAFVDSVDWTNAHGPALAASALFFKNAWAQFLIPSSYVEGRSPAWGTHPELDGLLSTPALRFIHHGAQLNRLEKLSRVAQDVASHTRLRVCWIQDIGLRNCGRCEKCLRTLTALEILGVRDRFTTFPRTSGAELLRAVRALPQRTHQGRVFAGELIRGALRARKPAIAWAVASPLLRRAKWRLMRFKWI